VKNELLEYDITSKNANIYEIEGNKFICYVNKNILSP